MKTKIFIIPGLGDNKRSLGYFFRKTNIDVATFHVGWRTKPDHPQEYFQDKLAELVDQIDLAYAQGYKVILIGTSAGGSFAVNAFSQREDKISRIINVSGRLTTQEGSTIISFAKYKRVEPVFAHSVEVAECHISSPSVAMLQKFVAFVPLFDEIVPPQTMYFDGAKVKRIMLFEHFLNIISVFTVYKQSLIEEL